MVGVRSTPFNPALKYISWEAEEDQEALELNGA
jgi:hypothetical protein